MMLLRMDGVSVGNIDEWDGIGLSVCREGGTEYGKRFVYIEFHFFF